MNNGWIKLHRKLLDNTIFRSSRYVHVWIWLLLRATHETHEFMWNGNIILVKDGQVLLGRKQLSHETGIPETTIERILKGLENGHYIGQQTTTKYRVITILNWKEYQKSDSTADNKRTTNGQQTDTYKNVKNVKNVKKTLLPEEGSLVSEVIHLFGKLNPSVDRLYVRKPQREAAKRLVEVHGFERLSKVVEFIENARGDRFCPSITTPSQLEDKWGSLEAYALKKKGERSKHAIIEI